VAVCHGNSHGKQQEGSNDSIRKPGVGFGLFQNEITIQ